MHCPIGHWRVRSGGCGVFLFYAVTKSSMSISSNFLCVHNFESEPTQAVTLNSLHGRSRSTRRQPTQRRPPPRLTPLPPVPYRSSLMWAATIKARHPSSTSSQSPSLLGLRDRRRRRRVRTEKTPRCRSAKPPGTEGKCIR